MRNLKYKILLALFIISLISSFVLSIASQASTEFCDVNGDTGCSTVYNSQYSQIFGIKNCHIGVVVFFVLSILTYFQIRKPTRQKKEIINYSVIMGFVVAVYFLYLQQFVLLEYCRYCLIVDFSMVFSFGVVFWKWGK
ncbi:MAG: vitamin K epoxide reductase family protein [Nanoarchaeota archaeon]|nr:vitamin K epoxide reductase family protein [Nanoarchaeota archaeon]